MFRSVVRRLKAVVPQRSPLRLLWHHAKAFVAAVWYGFPARRLAVIGITGTDGKTTTVGMVSHILQQAGRNSGALSTAFFSVIGETTWNATQKTSPSPFSVQRFLRSLVKEGCTHAILEYSSHGLVQGRTRWTWPSVAAVTNTTPEHLDYHGTMEQYRKDKGLLFKMLKGKGTKVLHLEDGSYPFFTTIPSKSTVLYASELHNPLSCLRQGETLLWITDAVALSDSSSARVHAMEAGAVTPSSYTLEIPIPGTFNLENALCAAGCALALGIPLKMSLTALSAFHGLPGRMERISGPQAFSVYVDFTVTPASYEKTLTALRSTIVPGKRLLVLTGSCGDRMKEKRPVIGRICSALADVVVVTNEDPYTEDPEKIIDDVFCGVDRTRTEAYRIPDRHEAIRRIFSLAREGDAVILCGKGSDTTMWVKSGQVPWNEREIAKGMLQAMFGASHE